MNTIIERELVMPESRFDTNINRGGTTDKTRKKTISGTSHEFIKLTFNKKFINIRLQTGRPE